MSELLAMLTNHMKWPDGSAPGGIPPITQQDVAAACKGMNRHAYLYALAKFCLDQNVFPELKKEHREMTLHKARLEGWRCDPEKVLILADLALEEALFPRTCKRCNGAGVQHNQRQCPSCKGRAFVGLSGQHCADALGITRQAWRKGWERRLDEILADLQALEDQIARHIRKRVHGS